MARFFTLSDSSQPPRFFDFNLSFGYYFPLLSEGWYFGAGGASIYRVSVIKSTFPPCQFTLPAIDSTFIAIRHAEAGAQLIHFIAPIRKLVY